MKNPSVDTKEIQTLCHIMQEGGTILYPTDTIWGLGCDALQINAVQKIFALKQRPQNKALILLMHSLEQLEYFVERVPPKASKLVEYYERPLTIVYKKPRHLPQEILAADGSIAIRVTRDPFCKALIEQLDRPLISTSANISGAPFPKAYTDIDPRLIQGVDHVANHRQDEPRREIQPSAIVVLNEKDELQFVRE